MTTKDVHRRTAADGEIEGEVGEWAAVAMATADGELEIHERVMMGWESSARPTELASRRAVSAGPELRNPQLPSAHCTRGRSATRGGSMILSSIQ